MRILHHLVGRYFNETNHIISTHPQCAAVKTKSLAMRAPPQAPDLAPGEEPPTIRVNQGYRDGSSTGAPPTILVNFSNPSDVVSTSKECFLCSRSAFVLLLAVSLLEGVLPVCFPRRSCRSAASTQEQRARMETTASSAERVPLILDLTMLLISFYMAITSSGISSCSFRMIVLLWDCWIV